MFGRRDGSLRAVTNCPEHFWVRFLWTRQNHAATVWPASVPKRGHECSGNGPRAERWGAAYRLHRGIWNGGPFFEEADTILSISTGLRHTMATNFLERGGNVVNLQKILELWCIKTLLGLFFSAVASKEGESLKYTYSVDVQGFAEAIRLRRLPPDCEYMAGW
jgi:hypothetical protein